MTEINIDNIPKVVIDILKYRIRIHRTTLKALGNPEFIILLVKPSDKSLLIKPTNVDDKTGHRLNYDSMKKGHSCEIYSQSLIKTILQLFSDWEKGEKYIIDGTIVKSRNLVHFDMNSGKPFTAKGDF